MNARISVRVRQANSWWQRARGLIGYPPPVPGAGMLFTHTSAVHGVGMRYPLDIVFLDRKMNVLRCVGLPRFGHRWCWRAHAVLELRSGEIERLGIRVGDSLMLLHGEDIFGE